MADIKNLEGMIDSTPIMKDYADIESSALPEYQIDSKIPEGPLAQKWTNVWIPPGAALERARRGESEFSRINMVSTGFSRV